MAISRLSGQTLQEMKRGRSFTSLQGPPLGSEENPASTLSALRNWYVSNTGSAPSNGVYWIQPALSKFQTYCLFGEMDGEDWLLMFLFNTDNQTLDYDASYWTTRNALNVSAANLDYTVNTTINVATDAVNNYEFRYLAVTNHTGNGNLSTYYLGSASNNQANLLVTYTSAYIATGAKVGGGTLELPWGSPSVGTGGDRLMYNQSRSVISGTAYARFGQAQGTEPFGGQYFTHRTYGVGAKTVHCNSSYNLDYDFGKGSGRHSAGGCGDNPGSSGSFHAYEIWVR